MVGTYEALLTKRKQFTNDGGANMAQKGVSLIKAAADTDNFLMRFSEGLGHRDGQSSFVVSCLPS